MRTPAIIAAVVLGITSPSLEELEPVRVRAEALEEASVIWPIEIPQEETPVILPVEIPKEEEDESEDLEDDSISTTYNRDRDPVDLGPVGDLRREPLIREHLWSESVTITHYCNCSACCGKWAGGGTASGTIPTAGRTVACGDLPFGTKIRIEGLDGIYIVEDRGVTGYWLDIYCDGHQEALNRGMYTTSVWIVEEDNERNQN